MGLAGLLRFDLPKMNKNPPSQLTFWQNRPTVNWLKLKKLPSLNKPSEPLKKKRVISLTVSAYPPSVKNVLNALLDPKMQTSPLSSCEIWIGSSTPQDPDNSRLDDLDEDALLLRDGIGVVYMPLLPNESKVPGFDPFIVSTWRRDVSADESQQLLDLAEVLSSKQNFEHGLIWGNRRTSSKAGRKLSGCSEQFGYGRNGTANQKRTRRSLRNGNTNI